MKKLFSALSAVFALIALTAAVCADDVFPDDGGAYNIEYRGESLGEYTLLVIKGVYGDNELETLLSRYADSDVMYREYAVADESGFVSFDGVVPKSYTDSTAIIGGTGLEKPCVAATLRANGAADINKLEFSKLEDVYTVNGSLGEDIEISLEALTYDSFGYPSLEQPQTEYSVSGVDDKSAAYISADNKTLVINRYAKDMTFEVYAKTSELSDSAVLSIKRAQRVPCEIKVYTDKELTNAVSEITVYGADGVFSPIGLYFAFADNFGESIEDSAVVEYGGEIIEDGLFLPEKAGTYVLTVYASGNRSASAQITVEALERPDYTGGALELYEKLAEARQALGGKNIRVFVSSENGNDIYPGTRWTTETEFNKLSAQVDSAKDTLERFSNGEIADSVAKAAARNLNNVLTKFNSSIKDGKRIDAESIALSISSVTLAYGKSITPKATLLPSKNTEKITWSSSDESVASVSQSGVIKATGKGTAVITAQTRNGIKAFCTVYAVRPITKLVTSESKISLIVGSNDYQLSYTAFPEDNNDTVRWYSSNEKVATVSEEGMVHAVSDGNAKIYIESSGKKKAYTTVRVGLGADKASFTSAPQALAVGKNTTLKASASRIDGKRPIDSKATITQISGEEYGYYAPNGKLYGLKPGKVVIMAEAVTSLDNVSTVIEIDIVIPATRVKLSETKLSLAAGGGSYALSAEISPENSTETVSWSSSNQNVAAVDEYGNVTPISKGSAKITAKTGSGKSAVCSVSVGLSADTVEFTSKTASVAVGKSLTLKAVSSREDGQKPISTAVTYEIIDGAEFAEIDSKGRLTALAIGRVTVRAYAQASINGAYADTVISVVVPITSLKFASTKQTCVVGDEPLNLYDMLTILPFDNTDILTWSSSNQNVAQVDEYGNVTPISKGSAKITVKSGSGKSAYCNLTVGLSADSVKITKPSSLTVAAGKTLTLKASAVREDSQKPVSSEVIWESSDETVATVDERGRITTHGQYGSVTFTAFAKYGTGSDSITLSVVPVLYSLKAQSNAVSLEVGQSAEILPMITAATRDGEVIDAQSYCEITYKSTSSAIVSVSYDGIAEGIKKGRTTVKVTVKCASVTKSVTVTFNITEPSAEILAEEKTSDGNDNTDNETHNGAGDNSQTSEGTVTPEAPESGENRDDGQEEVLPEMPEDKSDTENIENTENPENPDNTESSERYEDAGTADGNPESNPEDAENGENGENAENAETSDFADNTAEPEGGGEFTESAEEA